MESQNTITADKLLEKQAKLHRNCRQDRLRTLQHARQAIVSHCEEEASGKRPLHAFQKRCLNEELRTKALLMHDWKVLNRVTVGYLVANDLKYPATCLVIYRWRFKIYTPGTKTCHQYTCNKAIEEVLAMIDEYISAGRTCFP